MTALLEVAIGLIALYVILSLVVSAVNEALAGIFRRRAVFLEKGIQNLLGSVMAGRFFSHGLVRALARGSSGKPSYVSAPIFARTLLDLVGQVPSPPPVAAPAAGDPAAHAVPPFPPGMLAAPRDAQVVAIQAKVEAIPSLPRNVIDSYGGQSILNLGQALGVLARESSDIADLEAKVESWYDESMDRVSGWYKRRTGLILFGIGVVAVAALNADTLNIAKTLWTNPDVRAAVVAQAEKTVQAPPGATPSPADLTAAAAAVRNVAELHVPVGWLSPADPKDPRSVPADAAGWVFKIAGLLLTSIALSFGAPFWFDLLQRFVGIRASGPSPAKASGGASA